MHQPDHASSFATPRSGLFELFQPGFTSLERTVIDLARNEADCRRWNTTSPRFTPLRWIARIGRVFTGARPIAGLADERLEALRRFVALIRRRDGRAVRAAEALRAHGYRPEQLAAIEALALA